MNALTPEATADRKAAFAASLTTKPEFKIIEHVAKNADAHASRSVEQLVDLTATTSTSGADDALGNHCYDVACCTLEMAARTPAPQQAKLIEFIAKMQRTQVAHPETGAVLAYDGEKIWQDLPTFGYTFTDELGSFSPLNPANTQQSTTRWENITAFLARLTASSVPVDFSAWALTACGYAFDSQDGEQDEGAAGQQNEMAVRAAALWFVYAAATLWAKVQDVEMDDWDRVYWRELREGFNDARQKYAGEETNIIIGKALEQMKTYERSE